MSNQLSHEVVAAGGKLAPAAVVVTSDAVARTLFGMSFQDWVYILTAAYLIFQIVVILPRVGSTIKGWFNRGN